MRSVRVPPESRLLLFVASVFVPRSSRAEWRKEWDGEVWWWIGSQLGAARAIRERAALASHCSGAITDAFLIWFDDEYRFAGLRNVLRGAPACLASLIFLIAVVGVLSAGFQNTRRCVQAMFNPRHPGLAILSQTAPFMGRRYGVSPLKVAYWDLHSARLQGSSVYSWYRTVAGGDSVVAAKIGSRFFSLLGAKPAIGRTFTPDDILSCPFCAVVGYEFWKTKFRSDPAIVGRTMIVDKRPFRVIGVLSEQFWFPGESPAVWSLFDASLWTRFPIAAGALCQLSPGASADVAVDELRRLAKQTPPRESGTLATLDPFDSIVSRPLTSLSAMFLAFVALALLSTLVRPAVCRTPLAGAFFVAKTFLMLSVIFLAGFEFGGAASTTLNGGATAAAAGAFWWITAAGVLTLQWCWHDQRKRCHRCLGRLMFPVRIGEGSRMLLEPGGTEMACFRGHGILFTPDGDSIASGDGWYSLETPGAAVSGKGGAK